MIIEQINKEEIKITPENDLDIQFWANIKSQLTTKDVEIETLRKEVRIKSEEVSYLKMIAGDKYTPIVSIKE